MNTKETSGVSHITENVPEPTDLLKTIIQKLGPDPYILMNIATVDGEYGVLSRSVVYRGMVIDEKTGENVLFITERNSRKYKNLKENPKISVTFLFADIANSDGTKETWQVRLFNAEVSECSEEQLPALWAKEPLFAKIRSHISECGTPVDYAEYVRRHDCLLKDYESGKNALNRTKTFTAFKVLAKRWDFYKAEPNKIGHRVQYRRNTFSGSEKWQIMHVEP